MGLWTLNFFEIVRYYTQRKGLAKLDNIVREHVNHNVGGMFVDFHVVDKSGQIGQHCSPTNSIRHKLNAVYVVLAAV